MTPPIRPLRRGTLAFGLSLILPLTALPLIAMAGTGEARKLACQGENIAAFSIAFDDDGAHMHWADGQDYTFTAEERPCAGDSLCRLKITDGAEKTPPLEFELMLRSADKNQNARESFWLSHNDDNGMWYGNVSYEAKDASGADIYEKAWLSCRPSEWW